jgi:hypothetical protein
MLARGTTDPIRRYRRMRWTALLAVVLVLAAGGADARRRHHHHYYGPEPAAGQTAGGAQNQSLAEMVPAGWQEQHAEPNWNGRRFASPDGTASFAMFTVPVGDEPIAAHIRALAFGDGEEITYLRGQRTWIAVAGFKGDRAFYRHAVLACAGDRWHHITFEYPASAKAEMTPFIDRAAAAVSSSENRACDVPVSATR